MTLEELELKVLAMEKELSVIKLFLSTSGRFTKAPQDEKPLTIDEKIEKDKLK